MLADIKNQNLINTKNYLTKIQREAIENNEIAEELFKQSFYAAMFRIAAINQDAEMVHKYVKKALEDGFCKEKFNRTKPETYKFIGSTKNIKAYYEAIELLYELKLDNVIYKMASEALEEIK